MARPRPIAVVRLRLKIDTSVTMLMRRSTARVPTTDSAPMASGSDADTTLPNTSSSSTSVIGRAIDSARTRSSSMVVPTSLNTWAKPVDLDGDAVAVDRW